MKKRLMVLATLLCAGFSTIHSYDNDDIREPENTKLIADIRDVTLTIDWKRGNLNFELWRGIMQDILVVSRAVQQVLNTESELDINMSLQLDDIRVDGFEEEEKNALLERACAAKTAKLTVHWQTGFPDVDNDDDEDDVEDDVDNTIRKMMGLYEKIVVLTYMNTGNEMRHLLPYPWSNVSLDIKTRY